MLRAAIEAFPPAALRAWCEGLGQPTFVGSSGRVFPERHEGLAAAARLAARGSCAPACASRCGIAGPAGTRRARCTSTRRTDASRSTADATVLALGGASWPRLGSDGGWVDVADAAGIAVTPLQPANCGFVVAWSEQFRERFAGQPLKRHRAVVRRAQRARRGDHHRDAGIEGGAVYALSAALREAHRSRPARRIAAASTCAPTLRWTSSSARLAAPRGKQSLSTFLRKALSLSPAAIGLLHEATGGDALPRMTPAALARLIKAVPVRLTGTAPIARAISTAGGIAFAEVDERFMLRRLPGVFVAGEMLDWEAPTGGYLLQACFATGAADGRAGVAGCGKICQCRVSGQSRAAEYPGPRFRGTSG